MSLNKLVIWHICCHGSCNGKVLVSFVFDRLLFAFVSFLEHRTQTNNCWNCRLPFFLTMAKRERLCERGKEAARARERENTVRHMKNPSSVLFLCGGENMRKIFWYYNLPSEHKLYGRKSIHWVVFFYLFIFRLRLCGMKENGKYSFAEGKMVHERKLAFFRVSTIFIKPITSQRFRRANDYHLFFLFNFHTTPASAAAAVLVATIEGVGMHFGNVLIIIMSQHQRQQQGGIGTFTREQIAVNVA